MATTAHPQYFWLWVMCLTGVDYFSTLGYQPSIAFESAGRLAPIATVLLVVVTLCCALPVYRHVAAESPNGQGSIAMLERLTHGWGGKMFVLTLLGFAATDFVITATLSAADAAEHLRHNPYWERLPDVFQSQTSVTVLLLLALGAMFWRGFKEVIGLAVVLVAVYLVLNAIVIGSGLWLIATEPERLANWWQAVCAGDWAVEGAHAAAPAGGRVSPVTILVTCVLMFPKLALGLSGFETGVAVMPLVKGDPDDTPERPAGRIRGARRLLLTAAVIMSVMLLGSSMVTSMLIDPAALRSGGPAANRALAYLAHGEGDVSLGPIFGSTVGAIYDVSTVAILWFAGASAVSGLLNLAPRYLPRYGMAPDWAAAFRPMVVLITIVNLVVTWWFEASVEAQGGAYATGVMVLMSSAAIAVVIDYARRGGGLRSRLALVGYTIAAAAFLYTTVEIIIEKPEGLKIASVFIFAIIAASLASRTMRSTELRFDHLEFKDASSRLLWDALRHLEFPVLVPHRPGAHAIEGKERQIRTIHRLGADTPILFIEVSLGDTSDFLQKPLIEVVDDRGRFIIRVSNCVSVPHAIATIALELGKAGKPPELHFGWSERSPLSASLDFVLFGEGNAPWMVQELIRRAEPDRSKRPRVIVG
ncbi:MAG: hypothetical protein ACRCT8_17815 [Lacipirellulaceae bacterium]